MKLQTRNTIFRILYIILGSFVYSVAINALFIPHQLLSGGVTGIAMMLEYLFRIPTSISIVVLNIPLFWQLSSGWKTVYLPKHCRHHMLFLVSISDTRLDYSCE